MSTIKTLFDSHVDAAIRRLEMAKENMPDHPGTAAVMMLGALRGVTDALEGALAYEYHQGRGHDIAPLDPFDKCQRCQAELLYSDVCPVCLMEQQSESTKKAVAGTPLGVDAVPDDASAPLHLAEMIRNRLTDPKAPFVDDRAGVALSGLARISDPIERAWFELQRVDGDRGRFEVEAEVIPGDGGPGLRVADRHKDLLTDGDYTARGCILFRNGRKFNSTEDRLRVHGGRITNLDMEGEDDGGN